MTNMPPCTIDHGTFAHLIEAGIVRSADIVGQSGGWQVVVRYGVAERVLAARRGAVRVFKRFETLVTYLKDLGIAEFRVDASCYDPKAARKPRPDSAARLKHAHEAAAYDAWLNAKVAAAAAGIEDGSNPIIDTAAWEAERAEWQREAQAA